MYLRKVIQKYLTCIKYFRKVIKYIQMYMTPCLRAVACSSQSTAERGAGGRTTVHGWGGGAPAPAGSRHEQGGARRRGQETAGGRHQTTDGGRRELQGEYGCRGVLVILHPPSSCWCLPSETGLTSHGHLCHCPPLLL